MTQYVLGINSNLHDSAACLLKDGLLVAAAEQERFDRTKHSLAFPKHAIDYCLKHAQIDLQDLSVVTFPFKSWIAVPQVIRHFFRYFPMTIPLALDRIRKGYLSSFNTNLSMKREMTHQHQTGQFSFEYLEHHLCHAASAFFLSPFDEAAILSIDAVGEWNSTLAAHGKGNRIEKLFEVGFPHSLGLIYESVTQFLGFRPNCDESKVMGLSSYGDPARYKKLFDEIIVLEPQGSFKLNLAYIRYHYYGHQKMLSKKFSKMFGPPRCPDQPLTQRDQDIAAALQNRVEEAVIHLAQEVHKRTKLKNLCLAGGVALNCVLNEKVKRRTPFEKIYVQPAANDAGGAIGSALYYFHQVQQQPRNFVMDHVYWGPEFDHTTMKESLERNEVDYTESNSITDLVAHKISQGLIVGWFQGRMEIGPRALGNRSILADPRNPTMKDSINHKVKHREDFRPFAPSVLLEYCADCFDSGDQSPFMLQVYNVKQDWRSKIPAITHVDGTARVQTVNQTVNPKYYSVIDNFRKITGVPLLLNTSFNDNNEPIVCTPHDAVRCYLNTGLDALVLGDFYAQKNGVAAAETSPEDE